MAKKKEKEVEVTLANLPLRDHVAISVLGHLMLTAPNDSAKVRAVKAVEQADAYLEARKK